MKNVFNKMKGATKGDGMNNASPNVPLNKKDYIKAKNSDDDFDNNSKKIRNKIIPKFIPANTNTLPQVPSNHLKNNSIKKDQNYPVLQLLGIPLNLDWNDLISEDDIDNVGFTLTGPTGFDPDEVETFCDGVQNDIKEYRRLLQLKQKHFIMLLDEIGSLEEKLIEQQQENELANFIIESKTSEEQLKEEIVDLRIENQELRGRNKALEKDITQLKKSIANLNKEDLNLNIPDLRLKNQPLPELPTEKTIHKQVLTPEHQSLPELFLGQNKKYYSENDFSDVFDDLTS